MRVAGGRVMRLPLGRWLGSVGTADDEVLARARGPVIDVGCGPGRHLHELARRGVFAPGVDVSPVAVALARGRGATAIEASVFDELPGTGSWRTALLLDGNIGIGGRPAALLARVRWLLSEDGEALVELDAPEADSAMLQARIENAHGTSDWFRWARVSVADVDALAASARLGVVERWRSEGRWFARLAPRHY